MNLSPEISVFITIANREKMQLGWVNAEGQHSLTGYKAHFTCSYTNNLAFVPFTYIQ